MALPINIENLLNKQKIESNRIEFKKGWNPVSIYHSICAFANDFDDLGGGYILVGIDSDRSSGMAISPIEGLPLELIDGILQDMVKYNNKISPFYLPRTSIETIDEKQVLVIWCPAGVNRPYSVAENVASKGNKEHFYVRSGTSSIIAREEVLDELRDLACRIPFDERGNPNIKLNDISMVLLRDHLVKVGSKLADVLWKQPLEETLEQMELYTGPTEKRILKNVAAMMFCESPEKFFPYTQVDIVVFPNGKISDPNNFTEITFKGSVPQMIKQTMDYFKRNVIKEYIHKISNQQEAERFWNYPYGSLEESIVNCLYHRDYQQYEPVEITIEPDSITFLNCPGPDRSISQEAIKQGNSLKSRRYRNRHLGDFLKELDLTEGRSTGVPTIQSKLAKNGSPRAIFETTDDRLTFTVTIPIHEKCRANNLTKVQISSESELKGSERKSKSSESNPKSSESIPKSSESNPKSSERKQKSSEKILDLMRKNPTITSVEIAMIIEISSRAVEKQIQKLKTLGRLKREGSDFRGQWIVVD